MVVGFERTSYVEREDVGQFQVCVMVTMPPLSQPLDRMFSLSVSTRPGTAGIYFVVVLYEIYRVSGIEYKVKRLWLRVMTDSVHSVCLG